MFESFSASQNMKILLFLVTTLFGCASIENLGGTYFKDHYGRCHFISKQGIITFDVECKHVL